MKLVTGVFSCSNNTSCSDSFRDFSNSVQLYQHENNQVCKYIVLCLKVIFAGNFLSQRVFLRWNSMQQKNPTPWANRAGATTHALFPLLYMLQHQPSSAETPTQNLTTRALKCNSAFHYDLPFLRQFHTSKL